MTKYVILFINVLGTTLFNCTTMSFSKNIFVNEKIKKKKENVDIATGFTH